MASDTNTCQLVNGKFPCPHAAFCIHPCDDDECMLETIEQPNGPATPLTEEQCVEWLALMESHNGHMDTLPLPTK